MMVSEWISKTVLIITVVGVCFCIIMIILNLLFNKGEENETKNRPPKIK